MKLLLLLFLSLSVSAKTFKVGVLAPEGTAWSENLKKLTKEVKKATEGRVKFKIYYGGAQGDEPDVLRKIRVRQLHGGVFTGKTLGDINGDVRVIELPFTFIDNREKAWKTLTGMKDFFNETFENKGVKNLGFFEIGQVYFVSQKKTDNLVKLYEKKYGVT
ncbi:MAG: TRAP transporter substrate-binding protein DctP, partial [Bacteriovoracaceae bacterium]